MDAGRRQSRRPDPCDTQVITSLVSVHASERLDWRMQSAVRNTLSGSMCDGDTGVLGENRQQDVPEHCSREPLPSPALGKKCQERRRCCADASLANTTRAGKSKGPSNRPLIGQPTDGPKVNVSSAMMHQSRRARGSESSTLPSLLVAPKCLHAVGGDRSQAGQRTKWKSFQFVNGLSFVGIM